ncbi:MAG TPA: GNAT family N-acetyltransferase [Acetobacteraceae bacterium]|nr:GNAT family N-acetyltransferase [Acetobacteraceae bacterium]
MPAPDLRFETLAGEALPAHLPAVARLRTAVFRDWPYLYDGDDDYEQRYLTAYAASSGAAIVAAFDGTAIVGAATCQPMMEAVEAVRAPFLARGLDPARCCYFGESVLLREYRGRGAGVRFFQDREAHARALGLSLAAFCAVVRNENDTRRPRDYVPLDAFWRNRGYTPRPDLSCVFRWREIGDDRETPHSLGFWIRSLDGSPLP